MAGWGEKDSKQLFLEVCQSQSHRKSTPHCKWPAAACTWQWRRYEERFNVKHIARGEGRLARGDDGGMDHGSVATLRVDASEL